jgi:hypothetical protein
LPGVDFDFSLIIKIGILHSIRLAKVVLTNFFQMKLKVELRTFSIGAIAMDIAPKPINNHFGNM